VTSGQRLAERPLIQYGRDYSAELAGPNTKQVQNPAWLALQRGGEKKDSFIKQALSPTTAWMGTDPAGTVLHLLGKKKRRKAQAEANAQIPEFIDVPKYTENELEAMRLANNPRFAGMDPNEESAYALSQDTSWMRDLDRARGFSEEAARPFTSFDVNEYMNPYIKGALDPAAREIREELARQQRDIGSQSAMAGAFGGSRGAILESEARRGGIEAVSDLYSRGYASAFETARDQIDRDRTVAARAAEQFRATGAQGQMQLTQSIQNMLTTGGLQRALKQQDLDFKFSKFLEARDWDLNNLAPLLSAVSGVPYSTTGETTAKKSSMQTVAGIGMAVVGGFMKNPGMISAGVQTAFGGGGAPAPDMSGGGGGGGIPMGFGGGGQQGVDVPAPNPAYRGFPGYVNPNSSFSPVMVA
jgi:hypothetical protein